MMTNKASRGLALLLLPGLLFGASALSAGTPGVTLVPASANANLVDGDLVSVDVIIDFSSAGGTLGGGFDITYNPAALKLVSVNNAGLGDPGFGRRPAMRAGLLRSWAVGDFNGVSAAAPRKVGSVRFEVLPAMGPQALVKLAGTTGVAGPWVSGSDYVTILNPDYNEVGLYRGAAPPAAPTGIDATDGTFPNRVRVTFNRVAGATIHRIFRCPTVAQSSCGSPVGLSNTGSFDDTGVVAGTVYFYRVQACVPSLCGPLSVADAGHASEIPPAPTGVTASDGAFSDKTRVSWDPLAGVNGFRVYRCSGPDSGSCGIAIGFTAATEFDDPGGVSGQTYWYRVKACRAGKCSAFSAADEGFRGQPSADATPPRLYRFVSFDDDGKADVLLRHRKTGQWLINFMNWRVVRANSGNTLLLTHLDWQMMGTGDFNADGRGDVLLRNTAGNGWWLFLMNGRTRTGGGVPLTRNPDWVIAGIGDFDGDGMDDVLLRHRVTGFWQINFLDSRAVRMDSGGTPLFASADWAMMGTGDFNGDGRADVLLRHRVGGGWWLFLMDGRTRTGGAAPLTKNPDWVIAGIDDFDGDGMDDVLLRHRVTGQWQINFMDAHSVRGNSGPTPMFTSLDWVIQGTGDFNDDGRGDVLLRHLKTGKWWLNLMTGRVVNAGATNITTDLDWEVSLFTPDMQAPDP